MKPLVSAMCLVHLIFLSGNLSAAPQEVELRVPGSITGRLHVIAIGINATMDKQIGDLNYAVQDASLIVETFRSAGLPEDQLDFMWNGSDHDVDIPSRENILKRIRFRASLPCKTLVLFFSGHGAALREEDGTEEWYLIPMNADHADLKKTAVSLKEIREILEGSKAERKLLLLDCCRAEVGKNVSSSPDAQIAARFQNARATEVLAACSPGQKSWEDPKSGHGFFTSAVGRGLKGAADQHPADGIIDSAELAEYVARTVQIETQLAKKEQLPERVFTGTAPIPLVTVSAVSGSGSVPEGIEPRPEDAGAAILGLPAVDEKTASNSTRSLVYILLASGILCGGLWKFWPSRRRGVSVGSGRHRHSVT